MQMFGLGKQTATVVFWTLTWFGLNLSITLLNKTVFSTIHFPYPGFLTAVHMFCTGLGSYIFAKFTNLEEPKLDRRGKLMLFGFSFMFTINILAGNTSLRYVSVSFNQTMRASVPVMTMIFQKVFFGQSFSFYRKVSVLPICIGVCIACYGDIEYTMYGLLVTIFAINMASIKAIASSRLLVGEMKLHPINLLKYMTFFAFFQSVIYSFATLEIRNIQVGLHHMHPHTFKIVFLTGFIAFFLNVASFYFNKHTSALTICVAANVKQAMVISLAVAIFGTPITAVNMLGIVVVVFGGACYSYVGYQEKTKSKAPVLPTTVAKGQPDEVAMNLLKESHSTERLRRVEA